MSSQQSRGSVGHAKHRQANWHGKARKIARQVLYRRSREVSEEQQRAGEHRARRRDLQCWTQRLRDLFEI